MVREILTNDDANEVIQLIRKEIELVRNSPNIGREWLYKTGMYDKDGNLKKEFQ